MKARGIEIPLYFFADVLNEVVDDQQLGQPSLGTPCVKVTREKRSTNITFLAR